MNATAKFGLASFNFTYHPFANCVANLLSDKVYIWLRSLEVEKLTVPPKVGVMPHASSNVLLGFAEAQLVNA